MLRIIAAFFISIFLLAVYLGRPAGVLAQGLSAREERLEAVVTKILEERQTVVNDKKQLYQQLEVLVAKGSLKGKTITIENGSLSTANINKYMLGDRLVLSFTKDFEGKDFFYITDYVRRAPLYLLFGIFVGLIVFIGRKRGIASLSGMAFSFFIIFSFLLPQISRGQDPILISILSSIFIIPVTFYLSHGINRKASVAILGTIIALIITGVLANIFVGLAKLSGFASEEAGFVEALNPGVVNMRGLLLAGIIIGALGVLDDITVSQAAIVYQLKKAAKNLSSGQLFSKAMDVGRDHIASVVNTLVLVYAGASLPLLLLFINNPMPFSEVINYEILAEEIVRTLVASIGLVLAVPITTFISAYFIREVN